MQLRTPVAFLIFNRPETTSQVFETIRKAKPETLLVVADGPRGNRPEDANLCMRTREIIENIDWDCKVLKNYSDANMGCKLRVSSGLDWVFSQVEEAIILEDDCLPHPSFFCFCEEMLARYRDDERVMMIAGTNYLDGKLNVDESYFFSKYYAIWGWATWRRGWDKYDITMNNWLTIRKSGQLDFIYHQSFMKKHLTSLFDMAFNGKANTWDIQWFYTCLFNNGLALVPKHNLISNIGVLGTHSETTYTYNNLPTSDIYKSGMIHPRLVYPNGCYDSAFIDNFRKVAYLIKVKHILRTILHKCRIK